MRKPNINLKRIKLQQAQLQLDQYRERIEALEAQVNALGTKYDDKRAQVIALQNEISALSTSQDEPEFPLGTPDNLQ